MFFFFQFYNLLLEHQLFLQNTIQVMFHYCEQQHDATHNQLNKQKKKSTWFYRNILWNKQIQTLISAFIDVGTFS